VRYHPSAVEGPGRFLELGHHGRGGWRKQFGGQGGPLGKGSRVVVCNREDENLPNRGAGDSKGGLGQTPNLLVKAWATGQAGSERGPCLWAGTGYGGASPAHRFSSRRAAAKRR